MKVVKFDSCNAQIPLLGNAPCQIFEEGGLKCFVFAFQPDEEDLKAIKKGNPILFQVYKEVLPFVIYTLKEDGKPNI